MLTISKMLPARDFSMLAKPIVLLRLNILLLSELRPPSPPSPQHAQPALIRALQPCGATM